MALAGVSRADLLRAAVLAGEHDDVLRRLAVRLGFVAPELAPVVVSAAAGAAPAPRPPMPSAPPARQLTEPSAAVRPLHAQFVGITRIEPLPPQPAGAERRVRLVWSEQMAEPRHPGRVFQTEPLVRPRRLWPALRRSLVVPRFAGLDIPALSHRLANAQPVVRLPQREFSTWGDTLWVLRDTGDAMQPYAADQAGILDHLRRARGQSGWLEWAGNDIPAQFRPVGRNAAALLPRIDKPPAGTTVLVLGHLGVLARHPLARELWLAFARSARACGAKVVAWVPQSSRWVDEWLANAMQVHCLQANANLRPLRPHNPLVAPAPALRALPQVEQLLTLAACCVELQPNLLRALRLSAPGLRNEPGLEGLAWTAYPWVDRSHTSRQLSPEGIVALRPQFARLPESTQYRVWRLMQRAHQSRGRFVESAETLIWRAHARSQATTGKTHSRAAEAADLFEAYANHAKAGDAGASVAEYARDLLLRQGVDPQWMQRDSPLLARYLVAAGLDVVPQGLAPADVVRARQATLGPAKRICQLVDAGGTLMLLPGANLLLPATVSRHIGVEVTELWVSSPGSPARVVRAADAPCVVSDLGCERLPLALLGDAEVLTLDLLTRPAWALDWARDNAGLYATAPTPWGKPARFDGQPTLAGMGYVQREAPSPAPLRLALDPVFGIGATLSVGTTSQTFRYLPPSDFWMGSPEDEPGRDDDESPRHHVRLSQGFWLADTACTRALWQAVMGDNPSQFKGHDQRPVERVSFYDVQTFLSRLQALLPPGCQAVLPTEAQWEYACRAGSDTAFYTGATLSRDQANFDANSDTPLAPRGEASKGTVPVKSLPPTAWGLFERHGNVWEWCDDELRNYADTAVADGVVLDPAGQRGLGPEARRAVRGGSWIDHARAARSACRILNQRDDRDLDLGFRFALRSTGPALAEPGPEGQVLVAGPEGRHGLDLEGQDAPLADWRDADPPGLRDWLPAWLGGKPKPPKKPGKQR